jgi:nucleoside-diphosphate-sugar epimerase
MEGRAAPLYAASERRGEMKTVVVAGAVGVIGRAVLAHLDDRADTRVIAISRRRPDFPTRAEHASVDLLDPDACRRVLTAHRDVTHIVFAAYQEKLDLAAQVPPNLAMIRNLVETMNEISPPLRHVTLMQGGKAYGCHLGPFPSPAKESDPRHMPPNFYYDQEDFLREASKGQRWTWTALRPEAVIGMAVGNPMNLLMVIAVYALISKALGLPLVFPGTAQSYQSLYQVTDARILAQATEWAGETPMCGGEIFNITNGDYFRWSRLWPRIADFFQMQTAPPLPIDLRTTMADKAPVWDGIVARCGLVPHPYEDVARWGFGDFIFKTPFDNITSTIKARTFGFHDCIDSEDMFLELLGRLQQENVIPRDLTKVRTLA